MLLATLRRRRPQSRILASSVFGNILWPVILMFSSATSMQAADMPIAPPEVLTHAAQLCQCQPPTRSTATVQAPDHPSRGGPQVGPTHRHPGLDRDGGPSSADTLLQAQERRGTPSAPACLPGGDASNGNQKADLSGGGGPHPLLRPRALLVRADRDTVDSGLYYHPGLHRVDGRRGDQTHQSTRGADGGEREAGRYQDSGGRYHSAGSIGPLSQRDGAHEWLPELGSQCSPQGGPRAKRFCAADGESIQSSQAESPRIPPVCQDQGEQRSGDEADGHHCRKAQRSSGQGAGGSCCTAGKATQISERGQDQAGGDAGHGQQP